METFAKLIHKSYVTYLPTRLPVQFYGLPNGKVYVIYARFFEVGFEKSGIEYVFGIQEEFFYDYENEKLYQSNDNHKTKVIYLEDVDKPNPRIRIDKVHRGLNSFGEAFNLLNKNAQQLKEKITKENHKIINLPKEDNKLMSV